VREVFPDLVDELAALLEAEEERELPFGPGHRCVPLLPSSGDLILDVVDGRIMYIEILGRPPLRRHGQPEQGR